MKRFLMISGAPRSGTTLMQQVLNLHPRIALFHECNLPAILSRLDELFWQEQKGNVAERWLTSRETYTIKELESWTPKRSLSWEPLVEALWRPVFPEKWWDKGDMVIGDKWNLPHAQPKMASQLPKYGVRLLWMTRNPVDTAASWVRKETNEGIRKIDRRDLVFEALQNWSMAEAFVTFAERHKVKTLRIHYKDFCQNPMLHLKTVCEWLGVSMTETVKGVETAFFSKVPSIVNPRSDLGKADRAEIEDLITEFKG